MKIYIIDEGSTAYGDYSVIGVTTDEEKAKMFKEKYPDMDYTEYDTNDFDSIDIFNTLPVWYITSRNEKIDDSYRINSYRDSISIDLVSDKTWWREDEAHDYEGYIEAETESEAIEKYKKLLKKNHGHKLGGNNG